MHLTAVPNSIDAALISCTMVASAPGVLSTQQVAADLASSSATFFYQRKFSSNLGSLISSISLTSEKHLSSMFRIKVVCRSGSDSKQSSALNCVALSRSRGLIYLAILLAFSKSMWPVLISGCVALFVPPQRPRTHLTESFLSVALIESTNTCTGALTSSSSYFTYCKDCCSMLRLHSATTVAKYSRASFLILIALTTLMATTSRVPGFSYLHSECYGQ